MIRSVGRTNGNGTMLFGAGSSNLAACCDALRGILWLQNAGRQAATRARGDPQVRERVIGILGGMGPEATIDLFAKIVKFTGAHTEQAHFRILIDNNPKIPSRPLAIEGRGPSPLPALRRSARLLAAAGADFIVMPCVTAHYFYRPLARASKVPIVDLVRETASHVRVRFPRVTAVGLLATTATVRVGLFQKAFDGQEVQVLTPAAGVQQRFVMRALFSKKGIKAVGPSAWAKRLIVDAAHSLVARGAQVVIAGCTEVPLVLQDGDLSVPVVDPIAVLAHAAIGRARGTVPI